MAKDVDHDNTDDPPKRGRRKDGKPFKDGNTREDGSYGVGKNRTAEHSRFRAGDGRPRGRRPKGVRNAVTEWRAELSEKVPVTENGKTKKHTKLRAIIKATASRAMKGSDRATEIAMRYAPTEDREGQLSLADDEIIARWMAQIAEESGTITDDAVLASSEKLDDDDADQ